MREVYMTAFRTEEIMTTMTIPMTPELSPAIGNAAKAQGTTPETLAAEALRERFGRAESSATTPVTASSALEPIPGR